jgi:hypothetical protein
MNHRIESGKAFQKAQKKLQELKREKEIEEVPFNKLFDSFCFFLF